MVHVDNNTRMVVVDGSFRIRVYDLFNLRKPVFEHVLSDPGALLGDRVVGVAVRGDEFAVAFRAHILCGTVMPGSPLVVVKLSAPVVTCVGFHENHVVVGSTHGSLYYYNTATGEPSGVTHLSWELPVIGCRAQGPYMLAWDIRNAYRFHTFPDLVAPFQFFTARPLGVAGCGTLMVTLNETGNLWITDTVTQGLMRQIHPPQAICGRFTIDPRGHPKRIQHDAKEATEQDFFRLHTPVSYSYNAVYCDRRTINVLYPDGTCRKLTLDVK